MTIAPLPDLSAEFEPTRATLHAYAHAVAALPRAHAVAHPNWWHASLKVRPEGLVTDPVPLPRGGTLGLAMDLRSHQVALRTSGGADHRFDLTVGATASELGGMILTVAIGHGAGLEVDRSRFADDDPRPYDPTAATAYFEAFIAMATVFEQRRVSLDRRVGPAQVWPHNFDLAFEWFASRPADPSDPDTPGQINLGFYPGGDAYVYSSPWPFDPALTDTPLPEGASWSSSFDGAVLPYEAVRASADPGSRILEFAEAVFVAAAPGLDG